MEPALEPFAARIARVERNAPRIPMISNVTGDWLTAAQAVSSEYWCRHLRETVRFADGVARAATHARSVFLEVGPARTVAAALAGHDAVAVLSSLPGPRDANGDRASLMTALGGLWLAGVDVDWQQVHDGERRRRVALPTYPFERGSYWIAAPEKPAVEHTAPLSIEIAAVSEITEDDELMEAVRAQLALMEQQLELLQASE
jgi:acyl transferase domain-containing protein